MNPSRQASRSTPSPTRVMPGDRIKTISSGPPGSSVGNWRGCSYFGCFDAYAQAAPVVRIRKVRGSSETSCVTPIDLFPALFSPCAPFRLQRLRVGHFHPYHRDAMPIGARFYANWNVMVIFVVSSTGRPLLVAGRNRICSATRLASSSSPWPNP